MIATDDRVGGWPLHRGFPGQSKQKAKENSRCLLAKPSGTSRYSFRDAADTDGRPSFAKATARQASEERSLGPSYAKAAAGRRDAKGEREADPSSVGKRSPFAPNAWLRASGMTTVRRVGRPPRAQTLRQRSQGRQECLCYLRQVRLRRGYGATSKRDGVPCWNAIYF